MLWSEIRSETASHASAARYTPVPQGGEIQTLSLALLDTLGTAIRLRRDEALFGEGDRTDAYFKVVSGVVRFCRTLADGRRCISDFFLPGDFIGLNAQALHSFRAEAVRRATVLRYPRASVETLIGRRPQIGLCLLNHLCRDLSAAQERMIVLGRMTARERIASFLLHMADRGLAAATGEIDLPMNRTDIGDYLGLTIETVCRTLATLKSAGIIDIQDPHRVLVIERGALDSLARGV